MTILHRSCRLRALAWGALALMAPLSISVAAATQAGSDEAKFMAENDAAMTKMMDGMAVKPSGNIDEDFAAMMIPHHQGAIDMAMAELRYGKNEQLRRIAQEIVVEQLQEIAAMRLALGQPLPPSEPAPTQPISAGQSLPQPVSHSHSAHTH
ncbi:DUF305 domain-containing protein [Cupriavidus sp. TMH.W2]|uniref:DUF305 domain-containing protein n=1 Tax=Cupriavidus sp. TMH.W2 TaxID=3434465 RepID=UPI003D76F810